MLVTYLVVLFLGRVLALELEPPTEDGIPAHVDALLPLRRTLGEEALALGEQATHEGRVDAVVPHVEEAVAQTRLPELCHRAAQACPVFPVRRWRAARQRRDVDHGKLHRHVKYNTIGGWQE